MEETEMPWGVALNLFKLHLISALIKEHKLSPKEATDLIKAHRKVREPRIEEILTKLTKV